MKRQGLWFLAAIFLPGAVLGWLALRTVGEQQIILERRTAELYQQEVDRLASQAQGFLFLTLQSVVDTSLPENSLANRTELAAAFAERIRRLSPDAIAFLLTPEGDLIIPEQGIASATTDSRRFLTDNSSFLVGGAESPVFQARAEPTQTNEQLARARPTKPESPKLAEPESKSKMEAAVMDSLVAPGKSAPAKRNVLPQQSLAAEESSGDPTDAGFSPDLSDFRSAVRESSQGILARFVNNDLQWFFWIAPPNPESFTLGWMLPTKAIAEGLRTHLADALKQVPDLHLAILDQTGSPVFQIPDDFTADWKRPFVAAEIGEAMPFWEATGYLANPAVLDSTAREARNLILAVIAIALAAIAVGGFFVIADTRRQVALAQKKTDFVSNVSHELKTPLTSIRMFAELLAGPAGNDTEKREKFLRVISLESERLTRLINNVLDFSKPNPSRKSLKQVDLRPVIERAVESTRIHWSERGLALNWEGDASPLPALADPDAISQILVNLFSNAEKYAAASKQIDLVTGIDDDEIRIEVRDRGPGIPRGEHEKIFTAFHRADDCLASGIPGSGLGLTLARRIARNHAGDLVATPRDGGGSVFTLTLPKASE